MNARIQNEPTMEEILASIRKIVSEDTLEEAAPAVSAPVNADLMELPQGVIETSAAKAPAAVPPPAPVPVPADDLVFKSIAPTPAPANHSDIFSDQTRRATEEAFAAITELPVVQAPAPMRSAAPVNGSSVENVFERAVRDSFEPMLQKYLSDNSSAVIDQMKPLIREWMDEHFPALLEGAVRSEVERVVKARGGKH